MIKPVSGRTVQQTSQRTTPAPVKLSRLIDLVNAMTEAQAPSWAAIEEAALRLTGTRLGDFPDTIWVFGNEQPTEDTPLDNLGALCHIFAATVGRMPESLQEFIGPIYPETGITIVFSSLYPHSGHPPEETMAAAVNRYCFLLDAYRILKEVALWQLGQEHRTTLSPTRHSSTLNALCTDEQGKIFLERPPLLEFLADALVGVEAQRIGLCPICEKIFWRGRIDQPCCSSQCARANRNLRYREKYPEGVKLKRIAQANAKDEARQLTPPTPTKPKRR